MGIAKRKRHSYLVILLFAFVGFIVLLRAEASDTVYVTEAESNADPRLIVTDETASGGQAIVFNDTTINAPDLSSLNNPGGLDTFTQFDDFSSSQINALGNHPTYGAFVNDAFTSPIGAVSNGNSPQGQFRLLCTASHFAYDDPIVFPDSPGAAHLHMFWGNTKVDAFSNFEQGSPHNILESGASTCQGGAMNRSAYWAPAMLSGGAGSDRKIVMPRVILLYYKSHRPWEADILPQGIQLLVGNVNPGGTTNESFNHSHRLSWGCHDPSAGQALRLAATIPGTNGTPQCPDGHDIQATIQFPQCIALSGGTPVLTDPDFVSHTLQIGNNDPCPSTHPYRVPQISYLLLWSNPAGLGEASWRLSSDKDFDKPTGQVPHPGGSLHGDWLGGWHDGAINAWVDGCFRVSNGPGQPGRNCSIGQTGENGTGRAFNRIRGSNMSGGLMTYSGPQLLDDPDPHYTGHNH